MINLISKIFLQKRLLSLFRSLFAIMIRENWGNVNKMERPVTYISFEQGDEYCKWKIEVFTYQMMSQKKADYATILKENDKLSKKIKFRLPTANEWELIVKKGLIIRTDFTCVLDLT
jgi:hypothetical protein